MGLSAKQNTRSPFGEHEDPTNGRVSLLLLTSVNLSHPIRSIFNTLAREMGLNDLLNDDDCLQALADTPFVRQPRPLTPERMFLSS